MSSSSTSSSSLCSGSFEVLKEKFRDPVAALFGEMPARTRTRESRNRTLNESSHNPIRTKYVNFLELYAKTLHIGAFSSFYPTVLFEFCLRSKEWSQWFSIPISSLLTGLGGVSAGAWPRITDSLPFSCLVCDKASGLLLRMGRKTDSGWTFWCRFLQRTET